LSGMLSNKGIMKQIRKGNLVIEGADCLECGECGSLQPAGIDIHLGNEFLDVIPTKTYLDPYDEVRTISRSPAQGEVVVLMPHEYILGVTQEKVTLGPRIAAQVNGKSSLGRDGISNHVTAGFIDPGFSGYITLEIFNMNRVPIILTPGMPIGQLQFFKLSSKTDIPYSGKYNGATGPQASRYHLNARPAKDF